MKIYLFFIILIFQSKNYFAQIERFNYSSEVMIFVLPLKKSFTEVYQFSLAKYISKKTSLGFSFLGASQESKINISEQKNWHQLSFGINWDLIQKKQWFFCVATQASYLSFSARFNNSVFRGGGLRSQLFLGRNIGPIYIGIMGNATAAVGLLRSYEQQIEFIGLSRCYYFSYGLNVKYNF